MTESDWEQACREQALRREGFLAGRTGAAASHIGCTVDTCGAVEEAHVAFPDPPKPRRQVPRVVDGWKCKQVERHETGYDWLLMHNELDAFGVRDKARVAIAAVCAEPFVEEP